MPPPLRRIRTDVAVARGESERAALPTKKVHNEVRGKGFVATKASDKHGAYYETDREFEVLQEIFSEESPPAYVKAGAGLTLNLGNYESLRVDCSVSIPCSPTRIQEAYDIASQFVSDKINEEQTNWLGTGNEKTKGKGR